MDPPPMDKEKALALLRTAIESGAKAMVPILLNEGINVLSINTPCKLNFIK